MDMLADAYGAVFLIACGGLPIWGALLTGGGACSRRAATVSRGRTMVFRTWARDKAANVFPPQPSPRPGHAVAPIRSWPVRSMPHSTLCFGTNPRRHFMAGALVSLPTSRRSFSPVTALRSRFFRALMPDPIEASAIWPLSE